MFLEEVIADTTVSANSVSEASASVNIIESLAEIQTVDDLKENIGVIQTIVQEWPEKLARFGVKFCIAIVAFIICMWIIKIIRTIFKKWLIKIKAEAGLIQFSDSLIKVILYIIVLTCFASYFGIQTASLITLLGSGTVAIALALQGSLSNFIGGVLILVLKPFRVGDYIIEDNKGNEGTVIEIQLFFTKLRTVDDKIVILPNGALANSSLTNLNLSPHRRICLVVGISYDSDIKKAKEIIKKCIDDDERAIKGGIVDIYVDSLGDSSVNIGFRYFVENDDYWSSRWDILETIKYEFEANGISIPFNQMDVNIKKQ